MTRDLSGGLPADRDEFVAEPPPDSLLRDAANVWIHDDAGRFSLPRIGVERVGTSWDEPAVQANVTFAGGRVLVGSCVGPAHPTLDANGRSRVLGAGPVRLACLEPFLEWTLSYRGEALDTNVEDQRLGRVPDGPWTSVEVDVEMTMVVPPWVQGREGRPRRSHDNGQRFEQLLTARGSLRVGDETFAFTGSGLRIRRVGTRNTVQFKGHTWQSAVFPSGKAFGCLSYPDRDDGEPPYRDGYVFDGEHMYDAVPMEIPWITSFEPEGGDVSCVLRSALGVHEIGAVTTASSVMAGTGALAKVAALNSATASRNLFLHQGCALYSWDGETAYGMIERSLPIDQVRI